MTQEYTTRDNAIVEDLGFQISSPAFLSYEEIPDKYTFLGENKSPPLQIKHVPDWAHELILLVQDLDSPRQFINWLVIGIDPFISYFEEDTNPGVALLNSVGKKEYYGPTPMKREHRYLFSVFAIDKHFRIWNESISIHDLCQFIKKNFRYERADLIGVIHPGNIFSIE